MASTIKTLDEGLDLTPTELFTSGAGTPDAVSAFIYGVMTGLNPDYGQWSPCQVPPDIPEAVARAVEKEVAWYRRGWAIAILIPWVIAVACAYITAHSAGVV